MPESKSNNTQKTSEQPFLCDSLTAKPLGITESVEEQNNEDLSCRVRGSHGKTARAGSGGAILKKRALEPIDEPRKGDEKNKGTQGSGEEQRDA
jgi:hypothetical protein